MNEVFGAVQRASSQKKSGNTTNYAACGAATWVSLAVNVKCVPVGNNAAYIPVQLYSGAMDLYRTAENCIYIQCIHRVLGIAVQ